MQRALLERGFQACPLMLGNGDLHEAEEGQRGGMQHLLHDLGAVSRIDSFRRGLGTNGAVAGVPQFPLVNFCGKMWQHVATCAHFKQTWQHARDLRHFCKSPACPDPVWKPVIEDPDRSTGNFLGPESERPGLPSSDLPVAWRRRALNLRLVPKRWRGETASTRHPAPLPMRSSAPG